MLRLIFVCILVLTGYVAFGLNLPPTAKESAYLNQKNILINGGFENSSAGTSNSTPGWLASGGTMTVSTNTNDASFGLRGMYFDSTAGSQTVSATATSLTSGYYSNNCLLRCSYKTSATDFKSQIIFSGATLSEYTIQPSGAWSKQSLNFVCPSSGSIQARLISGSAGKRLAVDDCYLGLADNVFQYSNKWTTYTPVTQGFGTPSSVEAAYQVIGDTLLIRGKFVAGTVTADEARIGLPPGFVSGDTLKIPSIVNVGTVIRGNTADSGVFYAAIRPSVTYIAPTRQQVGFVTTLAASSYFGTGENIGFHATIPLAGDGQQSVVTPDQTGTGWSSAGTLVINATTTPPSKGTTTTDRVMWRRDGDSMDIRIEYVQSGTGGAGSGDYLFRIPSGYSIDTSKVTAYSAVEGSGAWSANNIVGSADIGGGASNIVGNVSVYDSTHVRIHALNAGGGGVIGSGYFGTNSTGYHITAQLSVPIVGWSAANAPQLVNSVLSSYQGVTRIETARVAEACTSTPCTLAASSGGISSISRNALGDYIVNFASGFFSAAPSCFITPIETANVIIPADVNYSQTATAFRFSTYTRASGAADDCGFHVMCVGPK